jgi:hypothetical protein
MDEGLILVESYEYKDSKVGLILPIIMVYLRIIRLA